MSEVERKIIWEKWRDPFGSDIEAMDFPGAIGNAQTDKIKEHHNKQKLNSYGYGVDEEEWNEDEYESFNKRPLPQFGTGSPTKVMITPAGLVPVTEHTRAGDIFNFWVAHTTFRITRKIVDIIDATDGVESLDIYTPYRCRISIGKAFDSVAVKTKLAENLGVKIPEQV